MAITYDLLAIPTSNLKMVIRRIFEQKIKVFKIFFFEKIKGHFLWFDLFL